MARRLISVFKIFKKIANKIETRMRDFSSLVVSLVENCTLLTGIFLSSLNKVVVWGLKI